MARQYVIWYSSKKGRMGYQPKGDIVKLAARGYINLYELIRALNHEELHSIIEQLVGDYETRKFDSLVFANNSTIRRLQYGHLVIAYADEYLYELQGEHDLTRIEEL